ncbi:MAG: hypothetical protein K6T59_17895 [Bryobacteraceae bacterium]|nr:hypothetical protein [Bryobacteraceae bacterium]
MSTTQDPSRVTHEVSGWRKVGLYDPAFEHDSCGVGFIAHIRGQRSHSIIRDAAEALRNMDHRGACGCEANTGDGAGMLTALPDELFRDEARRLFGVELPEMGKYAVAQVFLPRDASEREICKGVLEKYVAAQGQRLIGWRRVPTLGNANHGTTAVGLDKLVDGLPEAVKDFLSTWSYDHNMEAYGQQLKGSALMQQVYRDGDTVPGIAYTVISTRLDMTVTPYTQAFLKGAKNMTVQDACPLDTYGHGRLPYDPVAYQMVLNALDPNHPREISCTWRPRVLPVSTTDAA